MLILDLIIGTHFLWCVWNDNFTFWNLVFYTPMDLLHHFYKGPVIHEGEEKGEKGSVVVLLLTLLGRLRIGGGSRVSSEGPRV